LSVVVVSKIKRVARDPGVLVRRLLRRLLPNHPQYGYHWIRRPDGFITFREPGFVAAASPSMLLARHHYETARIGALLDGLMVNSSLEIGCGYGRLTPLLASYAHTHIAIDINLSALEQARLAYPALDFRQASADELPFPDDLFGLVTTWTVLQHIPPDRIKKAAGELVRVLAPGGSLLICEETRYADRPVVRPHTWHRRLEEYQELLAPLSLLLSSEMTEIDHLPDMESPGRVMLWRA
jgi:SAM-dependent methyltransferase